MHDYKQLYLDFALGSLGSLRFPPRRVSLVLGPSCSGTYSGGFLAKFAILTKAGQRRTDPSKLEP